MGKYNTAIDGLFMVVGTAWSLANIQTILGIVVLALQIIWLVTKIVVKVVKKVKAGEDISVLDDEVDDVISIIDKYANKGDKVNGESDGNKE